MPKVYRYDGPDLILGAFGAVTKGQVLVMTSKESVDLDKAFKPAKDKDADPVEIDNAIQREVDQLTKEELRDIATDLGISIPFWIGRQEIRRRIDAAVEEKKAAQKQEKPAAPKQPEPAAPIAQAKK
jgi:hypothetical protein